MINKNMQHKSAVFDGFGGMDASAAFGSATVELRNFRPLPDGSIQKREGYRHLCTLPDAPRASYVTLDGGDEVLLALCGNRLCRVRKSDGALTVGDPVFLTAEGDAVFFFYRDALYILDGETFYRWEGGTDVTVGEAYIPLIGKEWIADTREVGEPNEELNLLNRRAVYSYVSKFEGEENSYITQMFFDRAVESVDGIVLDGALCDPSSYTLASDRKSVRFNRTVLTDTTPVRVYVTLDHPTPALAARGVYVHRSIFTEKLFFFGTARPDMLYSQTRHAFAERTDMGDGTSFPLYVPASGVCAFDTGESIRVLTRMAGRLLVFTDHGIHVSKALLDAMTVADFLPICTSVGCAVADGVTFLDGDSALTVDARGLYRVDMDEDLLRPCVLREMSGGIRDAVAAGFFTRARMCVFRTRGEVWLGDPLLGEVYVLRLDGGAWSVFDGIRADRIFDFFGDAAFLEGQFLCVFDESLTTDEPSYGSLPIAARYKSGYFDLGHPESDKRASGLLVLGSFDGGSLEVRLSDRGSLAEAVLEGSLSHAPHLYERDLRTARFRYARLEMRAEDAARQRIYRAQVFI